MGKGPPRRNATPVPWAPGQPRLHAEWAGGIPHKQYLSCGSLCVGGAGTALSPGRTPAASSFAGCPAVNTEEEGKVSRTAHRPKQPGAEASVMKTYLPASLWGLGSLRGVGGIHATQGPTPHTGHHAPHRRPLPQAGTNQQVSPEPNPPGKGQAPQSPVSCPMPGVMAGLPQQVGL